jgi:phosphatidylinositol glycan class B
MGFLILGLGLHMLFVQNKFKMLASLALTFVATSLIAIYLDYWGYQSWTFTPWEYLRANLIDAKIDQFGRSPWWYYPWQSIIKLTPFFAIPCLAGLVLFIKKMPRHQWVWMSVPFIVFHFFIGHKELRFLYPVLPLIVAMTLTIIPRLQHRPWSYILCSLNILLLLFVGLRPANSLYQLYRVIWNQPDIKTLYVLPDSKGQHLQWERKILTRSDLNPVNIKHINDIQSSSFWALGAQSLHDEWWENKKCQIHYRKYPLWVQTIDYFKWLKRSTLWSLVYCP